MAWARVQHIDGESSGPVASITVAMPGATTSGNMFVVCVTTFGSGTVTVSLSDNSGLNTWTQIGAYLTSGVGRLSLWYAKNVTGTASPSLVVTPSSSVATSVDWVEYSGLSTTAPLDGNAGATGSSTSADSGLVSVAGSNELIFCGVSEGNSTGTITAGTGFTGIIGKPSSGTSSSIGTEEQSVSSGTHGTFTLGSSVAWMCIAASFALAGGGGTKTPYHHLVSPIRTAI